MDHPYRQLGNTNVCAVCGAIKGLHAEPLELKSISLRGDGSALLTFKAPPIRVAKRDADHERRIRTMVAARMDRPSNPSREPDPGVLDPDKCPSAGT